MGKWDQYREEPQGPTASKWNQYREQSVSELGDQANLSGGKDISEVTDYPLLSGIGKGMYNLGQGLYQRGLEAGALLEEPPEVLKQKAEESRISLPMTSYQAKLKQFKERLAEEEAILKPYTGESTRFKTGEILGEAIPTTLIPGGVSGNLAIRGLTGLTAGGMTGLLRPTKEKESMAGNIFWGSVGGGAAPAILAPIGKGYNLIKGQMADKYKDIIELSEQHGVPLTLGEVAQNPLVKRLEKYLEYVPLVGINRFRKMQGEATEDLAKKTMGRYGSGSISEAQQRMQEGLLKGLEKAKLRVNAAYDAVTNEIKRSGGDGIGVDNTRTAVLEMLDEYPNIFSRLDDVKLENKLRIIAKGTAPAVSPGELGFFKEATTQSKSITGISHLQGYQHPPIIKQDVPEKIIPQTLRFHDYDWIRKRIGLAIDKAYKKQGVGEVGSEEVRFLSIVKDKLDEDAYAWASKHPNSRVIELAEKARSLYKDEVVPYKDTLINEALNIHYDTDRMFKTFVQPDRVLLAGKMIANMEPKGVEATKYAIIKTAYDAASPEKTGLKVFSPNTFANRIKKFNDVNKEIFTSREMDELKGISNLMTYAGEAGQRMADPHTGQRLGPLVTGGALWELAEQVAPVFGGGVTGRAAGIGAGLGLVEMITLGLTTSTGRKLLLTASKIEPSHPMMKKIVEKLYNLSSKAGAAAAIEEAQ